MPTPVTSNACAILSPGFAGQIVQIRGIMCSDGVRRVTSYCGIPDTYFSLPCRVQVKGITVSGFAHALRRSDDSHDWQFSAARMRANGDALPDRSVYMVRRGGTGTRHFAEPAGYLSAKAGDWLIDEESGAIAEVREMHKPQLGDYASPYRATLAAVEAGQRSEWTFAADLR